MRILSSSPCYQSFMCGEDLQFPESYAIRSFSFLGMHEMNFYQWGNPDRVLKPEFLATRFTLID